MIHSCLSYRWSNQSLRRPRWTSSYTKVPHFMLDKLGPKYCTHLEAFVVQMVYCRTFGAEVNDSYAGEMFRDDQPSGPSVLRPVWVEISARELADLTGADRFEVHQALRSMEARGALRSRATNRVVREFRVLEFGVERLEPLAKLEA